MFYEGSSNGVGGIHYIFKVDDSYEIRTTFGSLKDKLVFDKLLLAGKFYYN